MVIQKQGIDISFARGLDTKTDPKRVAIGSFVELQNTIFQKGGLLQKRNGYASLPALPDTTSAYTTTFNENLTAIGTSVAAYSDSNEKWVSKGSIQPLSIDTLSLIRNNLNQTAVDSATASNGLVCTVYLESNGSSTTNKFVVSDAITGQNITSPAVIPVTSGTVSGGMRVFVLGNNFIILFKNTITAVEHLQYITVSITDPTMIGANTDIAPIIVDATTIAWDAFVVNSNLYIAYNTTSGGQSIKVTYLTQTLVVAAPVTFASRIATMMSVTADVTIPSAPVIYVSMYDSASQDAYTLALDQNLNTILSPTVLFTSGVYLNITSAAISGSVAIFFEASNNYSYDAAVPSHFIFTVIVPQAGTPLVTGNSVRSVGLASKAFIIDGVIYFWAVYQSSYQQTYFLINANESTQAAPVVAAKIAYSNGGGYLTRGLPSVTVNETRASFPYLFKSLVQAVNKNTNVPAGTQVDGIYSQTGINLGAVTIGTENLNTVEIGSNLNLTGGFLWMYDGYLPVENNFFLWPDMDTLNPALAAVWSTTGGSIAAQPDGTTNAKAYYYQVTYEWTDNQGNAFRSSPSIPIAVTTTGTLSTGSITVNVPTLRLTYKVANPVKIVIYRWSVAQQNYYQVTSITSPVLNNTAVDSVQFVDTLADASILGNNLLYTTGGVIENTGAPGSNVLALFDNRLWLVDAENKNLVWFSKQVIQGTPVEMSDLFTVYIAPTTSAQSSTGPIEAASPMDDKLCLFKENSIYYINGIGPDNTGANNQYSQPIFVTSTVGCTNQRSIVFTPKGLMFQSNKGIWLLDRGMNTFYIGSPVEEFNEGRVLSALNIPETNQVRFVLDSGITLMYDYFYDQWGTFRGVPALSSCIFEGLHTFINQFGKVYQESPGAYLDGTVPVLMKFKTGPIRLGDLQNYQRAYAFFLLGSYISPHKLNVGVQYDYDEGISQTELLSPDNYSTRYGSGLSQSPYGAGTPYGGPGSLEQFRILLQRQRCMAVAISCEEIFDSSKGEIAGAGLTLSGINVICGFKSKWNTVSSNKTYG